MDSRQRVRLVIGIAVLLVLCLGWGVWHMGMRFGEFMQQSQMKTDAAIKAVNNAPVKNGRTFSHDEIHTFLVAARKAEAIQDSLQRCLAYPDPPDSHWSPAAVKAYCQYHAQPIISFAEAQSLIQNGQASELDRRLEEALQAEQTKPESHGLLDYIYFVDFDDGSFDIRPTLDAWKRASPSSAFAYAASGMAYVDMAAKARGTEYIRDTPQSNIDAMDRLLSQADTDLQRAVALNAKVTPAYVAMIDAGKMSLGDAYISNAGRRGLAAAPDNYAIYGLLSEAAQPKWGGSLVAMKHVADMAQAHVKENPLLTILLSAEPAYEYDICNCESSANWSAFPAVFDNVASTTLLMNAGFAAGRNDHPDLAAIYLSEALRFNPGKSTARMRRGYTLTKLGESAWALNEANQWIKDFSESPWGYSMRGYAYKSIDDYAHATPDLEKAAALDPGNTWPLIELGNMYVGEAATPGAWDKAWDVANRLIQAHPGDVDGWMLRARIQTYQPRAGLEDTARYFFTHFGSDPDHRGATAQMRMMLEQSHLSKAAPASFNHPSAAVAPDHRLPISG
jgi:tetratricopeptide (TPR) repeat protein